ncbi:hypothetical protein E0W68_02445 [Flavobacterium salilacus subsp. salilacus]|uniref:hypothetical protein n=1 Tax=Flavobacterium TaxID=237 RepID=UPI001074DC33|nr:MULTISPECIES: hypothetical protein [Flavobacterium]KAF2520101.1 hypothetical protein E0W68_02445 [Flavobacterium salilacus subsp. salilacus]MBE1613983.1 hypothetical protein [Flavobacterium sp. SaA2.13]
MNTKIFFASVLLAGFSFTVKAQIMTGSITSYGLDAGASGTENTFYGYRAGQGVPQYGSARYGTYIGHLAGPGNVGFSNTFLGHKTGRLNFDGNENVFIGSLAGEESSDNSKNVFIGFSAARYNNGVNNTIIGYKAGFYNNNGNNIFLGYNAGYNETGGNKLYIANSDTPTPLIWGDFLSQLLKFNGKVGIGMGTMAFPTTASSYNVSSYKLIVNGGILAKEVRVSTNWADYVFEDDYKLPSLEEIECYIEENGHLPNVPSAKEVEEQGIEVGEMAKIQQEKIEELTLYIIGQNKQLEKQGEEIKELKAAVQLLLERQ